MGVRKLAAVASMVLGLVLIAGGIATWVMVSTTLADQRIVIPDDACLPERTVAGPFTAYCQAQIIQVHTLESTDGLTYAEMEREDPRREIAMNSAFLQSSLFTSIVAFGVAAMAMGIGVLFILIGFGMRDVRQHAERAAGAPDSASVRSS